MKRKIELVMALLLLIGVLVVSRKLGEIVANVSQEGMDMEEIVFVVDPGHGGEDPGKVGVNEALEKDINLKIGMNLKELLEDEGIQVVMTREDDHVPKGKMEDLKQRTKLINEIKPQLVICIHQNSYTDPNVAGPQVFYHGDSAVSEEIAHYIQEELWLIDQDHKREIKGNESYYMLSETKAPTVIVECGFLSNQSDAEKLVTEDYQMQVAEAICVGVTKWLDK